MDQAAKFCFVITPYGKKDIGKGVKLDFEAVFEQIIKPVEALVSRHRLNILRSKDVKRSRLITDEMIRSILNAEVAIVDISSADDRANANVFYELGLRHAFRKRVSVIIAAKETRKHLPFDVKDLGVILYDRKTERGRATASRAIADAIESGLRASDERDSPVFRFIDGYSISIPPKKCTRDFRFAYQVKGCPDKHIGIRTGDLSNIDGIDVWVNSENTELEMGRMCDQSISGLIRYHGAPRDEIGCVTSDKVQEDLRNRLRGNKSVPVTTAIATDPDGQAARLGVRKLVHVAVFQGQHGIGYRAVSDLGQCVVQVLKKLEDLNAGPAPEELKSVLFPVFGIRTAGLDPERVVQELVDSACTFIQAHPASAVTHVYFQAYSDEERQLCEFIMDAHDQLERTGSDAVFKGIKVTPSASVQELLDRISGSKEAAMRLRDQRGDLNGAVEVLRQGLAEGRQALKSGHQDGGLARAIADGLAMLAGNLLRQDNISDALAVYSDGRDIEMAFDQLAMTYNTVNLLVTRMLHTGRELTGNESADIARVVTRLKARTKKEKGGDCWTWADLGMCEFLRRHHAAALDAYARAARFANAENRGKMLKKIHEIRDRWPDADAERREFYARIDGVLS
ncbi:MAG: hypothetical protein K1X78_24780 [Verrucomicrobiaceae bacterium]|nr:hypothetical protein [Verrucomicrobiaceae bacterium]